MPNKKFKIISVIGIIVSFLFSGIGLYIFENYNISGWRYKEYINYIKLFHNQIDQRNDLGYQNAYNMLTDRMKCDLAAKSHIKTWQDFAIGYTSTLKHELCSIKFIEKKNDEYIFLIDFIAHEKYPQLDFLNRVNPGILYKLNVYEELIKEIQKYYEVNDEERLRRYLEETLSLNLLFKSDYIFNIVFINKLGMKDYRDINNFDLERKKNYTISMCILTKYDKLAKENKIVGINSFAFVE